MNLVLTRQVFSVIEQECRSHPHVETGGILVGGYSPEDIVAVFAIGSGPSANRTPSRFAPDVAWQQKILDNYFERYGLNYVGSFHRHPRNFNRPSIIDHRTAIQILNDPDWAVQQIVFPIILPEDHTVVIYPYYISSRRPEFELMPTALLPDDDPLINSIKDRRKEKCQES
jgi:integrative and conjugative element protein (TIGR02256 family)